MTTARLPCDKIIAAALKAGASIDDVNHIKEVHDLARAALAAGETTMEISAEDFSLIFSRYDLSGK